MQLLSLFQKLRGELGPPYAPLCCNSSRDANTDGIGAMKMPICRMDFSIYVQLISAEAENFYGFQLRLETALFIIKNLHIL